MPGLIGSTNCGLWNPFFQYKAYGARRGVGGKAGHIPVHVPCWKTIGCLSSNFHGFCEMQLCRYIHVCHVLIHMQCLLVVQLALIHMQHLLVIHPALVQGELLHLVVLWFMIIDSSTQKQVWWFFSTWYMFKFSTCWQSGHWGSRALLNPITLLLDQLDLKLKQHMQETLMDPLDRTLFVLFGASGSFLHTFWVTWRYTVLPFHFHWIWGCCCSLASEDWQIEMSIQVCSVLRCKMQSGNWSKQVSRRKKMFWRVKRCSEIAILTQPTYMSWSRGRHALYVSRQKYRELCHISWERAKAANQLKIQMQRLYDQLDAYLN